MARAGREPRGAGASGGRGRCIVLQGDGADVSPIGRGMCSFFAGSSARICSVRFLEWKIVFGSVFLHFVEPSVRTNNLFVRQKTACL